MTERVVEQLNAKLADRYAITRKIGAGGMATVFLARDLRHSRNVALKLLNPDLGAVLGAERFLSEIQVTANLQHPNLLPLFDSGEADGMLFYVMPFVDGESLRARLDREKQLPVDDAVRLAIAVCGALDYAHRRGVIHRDLKPENILLHEGQPLVADFGIALAVSNAGGARITQTGLSLGTPQYMSPEQATGDQAIDGRADIYSLGSVLYEMLTGDPPHTASTAQSVIAKVLTEQPRPVRAIRPSVPEHVEAALGRALEKLRADRWSTAHDFNDALSGRGAFADAGIWSSQSSRAPARERWRAPVVVGSLATAAIAVGVAGALWSRSARGEEPQVVRFVLTTPFDAPPTSLATWAAGVVTVSPDGGIIIYTAVTSRGTQLYARAIDQATARPIAGTESAMQPMFSPDGKWIAFFSGGKLKKVPVEGGTPTVLADAVGGAGGEWLASDVIVLGAEPKSHGLQRVSASGGELQPITQVDMATGGGFHGFPIALSDERTIVFAASPNESVGQTVLAVTSLDDPRIQPLGVKAAAPLGVFDGVLVFVQANGTVMAAPFDEHRHRITGKSVRVLDGVSVCGNCGGYEAIGDAAIHVSRNGTLVYMQGGLFDRLAWISSAGAAVDVTREPRGYGEPRLSPDGRSIAFAARSASESVDTDIFILDVATGTARRLTSEGDNHSPEWTPDGKRVVFASDRDGRGSGAQSLWWQLVDGTAPAERLTDSTHRYDSGVVSPDGATLVARDFDGNVHALDVVPLTGDRKPYPYVHIPNANAALPHFSPDGHWIVHNSNQSGRPEVYVRSFPNPGAVVPISTAGGYEGMWSHDGRHLFYRTAEGYVVDVAVTTRPAFAVLSRRTLFPDKYASGVFNAGYDASADGQRLLMVRAADERPQITVVTNWRAELRRRMGKSR